MPRFGMKQSNIVTADVCYLPPCDIQADSDGCGHCVLASARWHLDALLCTNMRTVSGVSGSDSVFAEDSCLQWCGVVTLSECSQTFRPIFREYSTTQLRTQIRRESTNSCYKMTHFAYYCSLRIPTNAIIYIYTHTRARAHAHTHI
jgi:hypothetical protein